MGWRALAVAATAAASDCADEPLWLDGARAACDAALCGAWFCKDCPFAGACDRTCGLCDAAEPCAADTIRDCDGRCTTDAPKSDGCCASRFNCASHDYDAGDCEPPASFEEAPASDWCILLTATICPSSSMTHTVLRDAVARRRDYVSTLESYAASSKRPIVLVENSGAALDELRRAAPSAHFVSFTDDEVDASKGKGHAEHRAIRRALPALQRCRRIVKITGRYFVEGLDAVLDGMDADVVVQSTPSPWSLGDGVLRSEVIGFNATLLDSLLGGQDESRGRPAERALFEGFQKLERSGRTVARFPPLKVRPTRNAEQSTVVSEL